MKAILIIDMPHICDECPFSWETDKDWLLSCQLEHDLGTSKGKKPDWCPLKPIPKKKNTPLTEYNLIEKIYENGWNECIEELEK